LVIRSQLDKDTIYTAPTKYYCRIRLASQMLNIASSSWVKVLLDTDVTDEDNISDLPNNRIVIPTNGYYMIGGGLAILNSDADIRISVGLFRYGTLIQQSEVQKSITGYTTWCITSMAYLASGGFYLYAWNNAAGATTDIAQSVNTNLWLYGPLDL